jgi:hypothetical protein
MELMGKDFTPAESENFAARRNLLRFLAERSISYSEEKGEGEVTNIHAVFPGFECKVTIASSGETLSLLIE